MMKKRPCPKCKGVGFIAKSSDTKAWSESCPNCHGTGTIEVPMTNGDSIRSMNNVKLAGFIYSLCPASNFFCIKCRFRDQCEFIVETDGEIPGDWCEQAILDWLSKPVVEAPRPIYDDDRQESGLLEED